MKTNFYNLVNHLTFNNNMFLEMEETTEGSMHHREENVLVHTRMVLEEYNKLTPDVWQWSHLEGAIVCLFHDVGKPEAEVDKFSEERGAYHSYPGHEIISARHWEDWAVDNIAILQDYFPGFSVDQIYRIGWAIEHHLPYDIKNEYKRQCIIQTSKKIWDDNTFTNILLADGRGRTNDNPEAAANRMQVWLDAYNSSPIIPINRQDKKVYMMIGTSGAGKSSVIKDFNTFNAPIFSLDACRIEWYSDPNITNDIEQYYHVHDAAEADPMFSQKVQRMYVNLLKSNPSIVIIDGTNLTAKHRRFYLDMAKNNKYMTHAVYVVSSLNVIESHQQLRSDKIVDMSIVRKQYGITQYPSFHEFDDIVVI